jgi:hypothetical protein
MDEFTDSNAANILKQWAADKGIQLLAFSEVEALGKQHRRDHIPPSVSS